MPGLDPRAIAYGIFNESSLRTQGPQRERNCAHRGGADSRFGTGGEDLFHLEARGDGSLRSQGRLVEATNIGIRPACGAALFCAVPNITSPVKNSLTSFLSSGAGLRIVRTVEYCACDPTLNCL